jgi:hypothetical protein
VGLPTTGRLLLERLLARLADLRQDDERDHQHGERKQHPGKNAR